MNWKVGRYAVYNEKSMLYVCQSVDLNLFRIRMVRSGYRRAEMLTIHVESIIGKTSRPIYPTFVGFRE